MTKTRRRMLIPVMRGLITNYFEHDVGKNAAALVYYLLFALFPLLIFLSNLLGILDLNISGIAHTLQQFLPSEVVGIIESYLEYVTNTSSHSLMWFSLVFTVWFPMRAASGLMDNVRRAYQLGRPAYPIAYMVRQLIYTIVLLVVIAMTLALSVLGERVLGYINGLITASELKLPEYLLSVWQYIRFIPVGMLMFAALGMLYAISLDEKQPAREIMPGIIAALFSWMIVSIGFSFYVNNFANYSVIYGTLGAVIILLMWLYMTAVILIMGAELNAVLKNVRTGNEKKIEDTEQNVTN